MKKYNKAIGDYGENIAHDFLINNGYNILDMNYSNRYGEIDIICRSNNLIIFCEVKSRYTNSFGSPMESVTYSKQKQIIKLSSYYCDAVFFLISIGRQRLYGKGCLCDG